MLLFESVLFLPAIHSALMLLGYSRVHQAMKKSIRLKVTHNDLSEAERLGRAREIARMVAIAAEHGLYRATCLRRSLLLWIFLRREGIAGKICFGVRMFDGGLDAHAWVEVDGVVINDVANLHEQYQPLHDVLPVTRQGL